MTTPYRIDNLRKNECCGIVLTTKDHKVLILKERYSRKWGFPKGKRQIFSNGRWCESGWEAAKRELMEETDIQLTKTARATYRIQGEYGPDRKLLTLWVVQIEEPLKVNTQVSTEIEDAVWIPIVDLWAKRFCDPINIFNTSVGHFFRFFQRYHEKILLQ
jgi:8-oxo-dGTP pyrophosphatase MutT (NUDIX family)